MLPTTNIKNKNICICLLHRCIKNVNLQFKTYYYLHMQINSNFQAAKSTKLTIEARKLIRIP